MDRKSTKINKSIYQQCRESCDMTRADVADKSENLLTESRLEKIENFSTMARPEDIIIMSKVYNKPEICNYYCTNECQIGKKYVSSIETIHELPQITLELLSSLNTLNHFKERIIDITADGTITNDEKKDFEKFREHLSEMSQAIETLKLWADKELN